MIKTTSVTYTKVRQIVLSLRHCKFNNVCKASRIASSFTINLDTANLTCGASKIASSHTINSDHVDLNPLRHSYLTPFSQERQCRLKASFRPCEIFKNDRKETSIESRK